MTRFPSGLQFSLVELLAIVLAACLSAAALRSGGTLGLALVQGALCLFVVMFILAIVARESWQAFAIGFILGVAGYCVPVLYVGESELHPYTARLPLTKALRPLWENVVRDVYVDPQTGDEFSKDEVTTVVDGVAVDPLATPDVGMGPYQLVEYRTGDGRFVESTQRPLPSEFLLAAHACLAIAIGYVAGKFAAIVYRRRSDRAPPSETNASHA